MGNNDIWAILGLLLLNLVVITVIGWIIWSIITSIADTLGITNLIENHKIRKEDAKKERERLAEYQREVERDKETFLMEAEHRKKCTRLMSKYAGGKPKSHGRKQISVQKRRQSVRQNLLNVGIRIGSQNPSPVGEYELKHDKIVLRRSGDF
jgi:hypothetical protein